MLGKKDKEEKANKDCWRKFCRGVFKCTVREQRTHPNKTRVRKSSSVGASGGRTPSPETGEGLTRNGSWGCSGARKQASEGGDNGQEPPGEGFEQTDDRIGLLFHGSPRSRQEQSEGKQEHKRGGCCGSPGGPWWLVAWPRAHRRGKWLDLGCIVEVEGTGFAPEAE